MEQEIVTYRRRRSAIARTEREWRVEEQALVSVGARGARQRTDWRDIVSVRLCMAPTRFKPWRYIFEMQLKNGRKLAIDNAHYAGAGDFEDRSESYSAFVRAALARIAAKNPKARALIGETPKRYFFLLLTALIGFGAVAFALIAFPTPFDGLAYASAIKLAILLLMLPIFGRWVLGAMPRGVALDDIPARALPLERKP